LGGGTPRACTPFNNKTWQEYQQWKNTYQQSYEQIYQRPLKCIYGCPREISDKKFPPQAKILVVEMNNDENKIMGIGEIINQTANEVYRSNNNKPQTTASARVKFNIFSDRNYTRYIYIGNTYYASREELERNQTEDAQYINKQLEGLLPQQTTPATPPTATPPTALGSSSGASVDGGRNPPSTSTPASTPATPATAPATPATALGSSSGDSVDGGRNPPSVDGGRNPPATSPSPPPSNSTEGQYLRQNHPPSWGGGTPGGTLLERLLFKGKGHMKRGSGISKINTQGQCH
jgi:hypothetical protein